MQYTYQQIHKFCTDRIFMNEELYRDQHTGHFSPVYLAADFIFQHCLEDAAENILYLVMQDVQKWYNRADAKAFRKGIKPESIINVVAVNTNDEQPALPFYHGLESDGIFAPEISSFLTYEQHQRLYSKKALLYTQFLKTN